MQKLPGSSSGEEQSAVSTNAHGTLTGLGGKKIKTSDLIDTVPFVETAFYRAC